jgi:hypothetical protein
MKNNDDFRNLINFFPRSRLPAILLCIVLLYVNSSSVHAHPYLPLNSGSSKIFRYHFHIGNAKMAAKPDEVHGEITMKFDTFEEKSGKRYLRQTTTYRNIPYMKTEQHVWKREENGNIYLAWMLHGKWNETLELSEDVSLGHEWEFFDGVQSKKKVTRIFDLKLADGEILTDCIEISHIIPANQKLNMVDKSYYCRDIGDAGSLFRQPTPDGDFTTETILKR